MAIIGKATLRVTPNGGIQASNYNDNSFWVENTGGKTITKIEIDVTGALFPDTVFDPFGQAGDTVSKKLTINTNGATGVVAPSDTTSYIGAGGTSGYEKIQITFASNVNSGFQPGEAIGFSIDMDPNSIAGSLKSTLDAGTQPAWDVGGVNGAELIGSEFIVTFADGTNARGQLQGLATTGTTNSQGGAQALATQEAPAGLVTLTVAGLTPGQAGTYSDTPQVVISGPANQTARVVLAKGLVQPTTNLFEGSYASQFDAQIKGLFASRFPANNAVEFEVIDVSLTGAPQNITSMFNFTSVPVSGVLDADRLPLGLVAGLIDKTNGDLPIGPVTTPVYLRATNVSPVAADDTASTTAGTAVTLSVLTNDTDADGDTARLWSVTQGTNGSVVKNGKGTLTYTPTAGFSGTDSFTYTVMDGQGGTDTATVKVTVAPERGLSVPAINAGGSAFTASTGTAYGADQYFSGGSTFATGAAIAGTTDDALYQTERFGGNFSYAMPVANGTYDVTLQFAEIYFDAAGQRVFDVSAEGKLVLDDLDIWSAAGNQKNTAYDVTVPVSVQDGTLNLQFLSSVNNAKISAIRVVPASSNPQGAVTVTQSGGSTAVTEGGATDTLSMVLTSQPTSNVTVTVNGTADVSGNPTTLTFTSTNWNVAQNVTVAAVNDTLVEGPETSNLSFSSSSTDTRYNNLTIAPVSVSITDNDTTPGSVAVNAGGSAFTASNGTTYGADQYFSGGSTFATGAAIAGTTDDALYQTERFGGNFSYAMPVANGTYDVTLQFAEIYFDAAGQRVFDVSAEGKLVLDDLDIWSAAGNQKNTAYDVTVPVSVQDGTLNLQFLSSVNNAKISAIRVVPASSNPQGAVTVTQSGGSTAVTEGGATDTLSMVLTSQPTSNVTVTVTGNPDVTVAGPGGTQANTATLTFTSANWNVAQNVTVAAVNDTLVEGPETSNLSFSSSSTDTRYNNLTIAPVSVSITDNDHTPVVVDTSTALTGALGAQSWGTLDVSALSWSGAAALVTKTVDGLGVQGGRYSEQVDFNPSGKTTELLRLDFDGGIASAVVRLGRMNVSENGTSGPEIGLWKAYDTNGSLVGQGTLDPRQGTVAGASAFDFLIDPAADFTRLDLTAGPYPNATSSTGDSSDFSLMRVAYQPDFVI